jgi:hypothetical protein
MNKQIPTRFARLGGMLAAIASLVHLSALAQSGFTAGSNGSLGDVVITNDTNIVLPPDGVLHYRSFTVLSNVNVGFIRNANNTPVYLLSQGDVILTGKLWLTGGGASDTFGALGGPGGFDGGRRGNGSAPAGDGNGPGGGKAGIRNNGSASGSGAGGFMTPGAGGADRPSQHGGIYGNAALIPLIGGSGGGGNELSSGGGGGGAILIASDTKVEFVNNSTGFGHIFAYSGRNDGQVNNQGSGGAVKIVAPWITGQARIHVYGFTAPGGTSEGRIRLDAQRYDGLSFPDINPTASLSNGAMMATGLEGGLPQLSVASFAGRDTGTNRFAPLNVVLPNGSATNQSITIRAENFGTLVPVSVVLTPDNGPRIVVPAQIDNRTQNPAVATLNVPVPANVPVQVRVWTR